MSMSSRRRKAGVKLIKNATKPALKYNFKASVENRSQRQTPVFYNKEYLPMFR